MSVEAPKKGYDILLIQGAPGSGKTSLAQVLHQQLESPWFEFGWIPEFRLKGEAEISYDEEEQLSFENLCLVVKNYLRHGFTNILITDLRDLIMQQALKTFQRKRLLLVTLVLTDEEILKERVLREDRSSGYRDWQEALAINRLLSVRPTRKNEIRIDVTYIPVEAAADQVMAVVEPFR